MVLPSHYNSKYTGAQTRKCLFTIDKESDPTNLIVQTRLMIHASIHIVHVLWLFSVNCLSNRIMVKKQNIDTFMPNKNHLYLCNKCNSLFSNVKVF